MKNPNLILIVFIALTATIASRPQSLTISTADEIKADIAAVPCKSGTARGEGVRALFKKFGAADADIAAEKFSNGTNLVVTKAGKTAETIVIGAHFDKVSTGCGAIDNWAGVVIVANLFRTLRTVETRKTIKFVAFDAEEEGLLGSRAMADKFPEDKRSEVCAMVNFDSFSDTFPQAGADISSPKLVALAETVSGKLGITFGKSPIVVGTSDSASFIAKGMPAVTMHGLSNKSMARLHSTNDKVDNVVADSVLLGYRHGLLMAFMIDESPCAAWRSPEKKK